MSVYVYAWVHMCFDLVVCVVYRTVCMCLLISKSVCWPLFHCVCVCVCIELCMVIDRECVCFESWFCVCVCVCVLVFLSLWGHQSVYTVTLRGPVPLWGRNRRPHSGNSLRLVLEPCCRYLWSFYHWPIRHVFQWFSVWGVCTAAPPYSF